MRKRVITTALFGVLFIIFWFKIPVSAMNTDFSTRPLTPEEVEASELSAVAFSKDPPINSVVCLDVNENGMIAIALDGHAPHTVVIYSNEGVFQYGYNVNLPRQEIGIEWDKNNVLMYSGDRVISVDPNGIIEEKAKLTEDDNVKWNSVTKRIDYEGDYKYILKNKCALHNLVSSYSQIIRIDRKGNETVLYDVHEFQTIKFIGAMLVVFFFIVSGVTIIVRTIKTAEKNRKQREMERYNIPPM